MFVLSHNMFCNETQREELLNRDIGFYKVH